MRSTRRVYLHDAEVVAADREVLVRTEARTVALGSENLGDELTVEHLPALADLLTTGVLSVDAAVAAGLPPSVASALPGVLLSNDVARARRPPRTRIAPITLVAPPRGSTQRLALGRVLVVGAGPIGQAVAHALLASGAGHLVLAAPELVSSLDVGRGFVAAERGLRRAEAVLRRSPRSTRPRITALGCSTLDELLAHVAASPEYDAVVGCFDDPTWLAVLLARACGRARHLFVSVHRQHRRCLVSPVLPRGPSELGGCPECMIRSTRWSAFDVALRAHIERTSPATLSSRLGFPAAVLRVAADLTCARLVAWSECGASEGSAWSLDTRGRLDVHRVSQYPWCKTCNRTRSAAQAERDARNASRLLVSSTRKGAPAHDGEVPLQEMAARLGTLCEGDFRLIGKPHDLSPMFRSRLTDRVQRYGLSPRTSALCRVQLFGEASEQAAVSLDDAQSAFAMALCENAEFFFSIARGADLHAPLRKLDPARVIDPRRDALFTDEQLASPDFPFRSLSSPDTREPWVWMTDLSTGEPRLLHGDFVLPGAGKRLFEHNTSGGGFHSSRRRAVSKAIYEYVERDALTIYWLNRLSPPRIRTESLDEPARSVATELERVGYRVRFLLAATDLQIPTVFVTVTDTEDPDFFMFASGAAATVAFAAQAALREALHGVFLLPLMPTVYPDLWRQFREMMTTPTTWFSGLEHILFWQNRAKHSHLRFLSDGTEQVDCGVLRPTWSSEDSADELRGLVSQLTSRGFAPLASDRTPPVGARVGASVAKVFVPGLVPFSWSHLPLGNERIVQAPVAMGMRKTPLAIEALNPWPHPLA